LIRQRSYVDMVAVGGRIRIDHLTAPLVPTRHGQRVAFCNNLLLHHGMQAGVPFADGSDLDEAAYERLARLAGRLTVEVAWQSGDVLMVDNTRMMHGRRAILDERRLILTRFGS